MHGSTNLWFPRDLRLTDNRALAAALQHGGGVLPVYVLPARLSPGEAAWLPRSLARLDSRLRARGSRLVVRGGPVPEALASLAQKSGARSVHCTRVWTGRSMNCSPEPSTVNGSKTP